MCFEKGPWCHAAIVSRRHSRRQRVLGVPSVVMGR
jgi:hypothetical protein